MLRNRTERFDTSLQLFLGYKVKQAMMLLNVCYLLQLYPESENLFIFQRNRSKFVNTQKRYDD